MLIRSDRTTKQIHQKCRYHTIFRVFIIAPRPVDSSSKLEIKIRQVGYVWFMDVYWRQSVRILCKYALSICDSVEKIPGSCRGDGVRRRKAQVNGSQVCGKERPRPASTKEAKICVGFPHSVCVCRCRSEKRKAWFDYSFCECVSNEQLYHLANVRKWSPSLQWHRLQTDNEWWKWDRWTIEFYPNTFNL